MKNLKFERKKFHGIAHVSTPSSGTDTLLEIVNINQRIYIAYEIRHN
jgi:hypothetical protein